LYIRFSSSESEANGLVSYSLTKRHPSSEESAKRIIFCLWAIRALTETKQRCVKKNTI
jgi:hypothetical protein